jgi:DNA-binding PadR family transcriptional regulator
MFNSVTSFKEQFSFWTESAIRRILKNLESEGYLETGRFNKYGYDKTKWYTVTPKALCVAEKDNGLVETASSWSDS